MDKKLAGLVTLFFLAFLFFISVVVFNRPLTQLTRAKEDTAPSAQKSIIFGWPLSAPADGTTQVQLTVFVRSDTNKLLSGKSVGLTSTLGDLKALSGVSDQNGKASFVLTSTEPGIAEVSGIIENSIPLEKKLTIKFE